MPKWNPFGTRDERASSFYRPSIDIERAWLGARRIY